MPNVRRDKIWHLYLVRCRGGMLYTGVTCDVERRFREHQAGRGAKYLRGRGTLELVFQTPVGTRSRALRLEREVKRLPKPRKEALAAPGGSLESALAPRSRTGSRR